MLGARLVYDLLTEGYNVKAIFRNEDKIFQFIENVSYYTANSNEINKKIEWVKCDILNYPTLLDILDDVYIVFHCAAMVSFNTADKYLMHETNITGTANLVNACIEKKINRFCHVSSIAALGHAEKGSMVNENTSWQKEKKTSDYSISKFHSEMEVWRGIAEGLESVIINPAVILGVGNWNSGSPAFFKNIDKGMKFYTSGSTGYVDVSDVSKAMILLTNNKNWEQAKGNRYLLSTQNMTFKEFFGKIAITLNVKTPSIEASKFMLGLAWRLAWLLGKLTRKKPLITRHSTEAGCKKLLFDGSKISKQFDFQYRTIDETISQIGNIYITQKKKEIIPPKKCHQSN